MDKRIPALVVALFFTACSPSQTFDLSRPIYFDIPPGFSDGDRVKFHLIVSINQLGGRGSSSLDQVVRVEVVDCPTGIGGDVSWQAPTTVRLCPSAFTDDETLAYVCAHELGHVLGVHGHLPCDTGAIMADRASCSTGYSYTPIDVTAICDTAIGGACNSAVDSHN